jgi:phage virion morphogenesis protein
MAGSSLRCGLQGDFRGALDGIRDWSRLDFGELNERLGAILEDETAEAFKTSTSPAGEEWPVSGRVEKMRARRKPRANGKKVGKTLIQTARLKNSIHTDADDDQVVEGTDVVYARIHQFGGEAGRKDSRVTIPRRSFIPVTADGTDIVPRVRERLTGEITEYLKEVSGL